MANSDLARLINSDEIQSVVNAPKAPKMGKTLKKNPLKNLGAMLKLNPYAKTVRRQELAMAVRSSHMLSLVKPAVTSYVSLQEVPSVRLTGNVLSRMSVMLRG